MGTEETKQEITCPNCNAHFIIFINQSIKYCPSCRDPLQMRDEETSQSPFNKSIRTKPLTLFQEHVPSKDRVQFTIGPYQILESIGKGGMGEVFLAYDTRCGRRIALKRIRPDLKAHHHLQLRFLKEARITSQLTHPAIIPIYTIKGEDELAYYTMPYVEGKTLKEMLISARTDEKQGVKQNHIHSIPSLVRIFFSVCQAVAYAHSKGVIHRDLKPNNVIVGPYGEVLILDWGLAKLIKDVPEKEATDYSLEQDPHKEVSPDETSVGRVVGTVAYIAPERAFGKPASYQTDIYSLGVTLYQILTLHHPFHRKNLQEFRQNLEKEVISDPAIVAPYRDVPPELSRIVLKCLSRSTEERYHSVNQLINDLEGYLEGRSDWFIAAELNTQRKSDWEFQENVLLAEHMAITRGTEISDWVLLMISKASFSGNTKLEATVTIGEKGHGLGFLLSVPEAVGREHPNSGYCLWLASDLYKSTKLLRATAEVMSTPDVYLQRHVQYQIRIEKIENNIHLYINDALQFSYISHLPLNGTHVGLLARDVDFTIEKFHISIGSQNLTVNCLAVPDAFLAYKDYATALTEYRRIGNAFPGTAEGREALFRAGITLLEEARNCIESGARNEKKEDALEEFGKLRRTPGAPLEYLGKALTYQSLGDYEEEIKCFEMAHRRYPNHPILPILQEQLLYRMFDSSRLHRKATYEFALLAIRHFPAAVKGHNARKLFSNIRKNWEPLYFIEQNEEIELYDTLFAIELAFWAAKPHVLIEIINELLLHHPPNVSMICNALFALIELDRDMALQQIEIVKTQIHDPSLDQLFNMLSQPLDQLIHKLPEWTNLSFGNVIYLMGEALHQQQPEIVLELYAKTHPYLIIEQQRLQMDCLVIWAYLLLKDGKKTGELLKSYSLEQLTQESSLLYFLYGCWLSIKEGKDAASTHFSSVFEIPYPRSWAMFNHFINKSESDQQIMLNRSFKWERKQLYRQLSLYYHCIGDKEKAQEYRVKEDD